ncbi:MAG: 1-acyl-sn-glycerol-3-phosphate acyltransferase [Bacteroidales bacterium]|nr:1-acyl-sn-glycerol-3-phosphate acyltransferase [Bacteroidales bacterium]
MEKLTLGYRLTKAYFRFASDGIFYRKRYIVDADHIPPEGTPVLVAMNHQNTFHDILGVLFARNDRKMHFIARADAFEIHPLFRKFLLWAGVLPAFRMQYQGEEALSNNYETFRITEQNLLDGHTVLIFPEAGHQNKRWLGTFSLGYLRMAFEAAASAGFEKEIFILPAAHHYSNYRGLREQTWIRFGTPISLKPWYERYKDKPRTCQREVNALVREQIQSMMLDIRDLEHYKEIDFLRTSGFGKDFALSLGKKPDVLPEKLEADKELVKRLAAGEPDYGAVETYRTALEKARFEDGQVAVRPSWGKVVWSILLLVLTLPLAVFCLWPALPNWFIPQYANDHLKDDDGMYLTSFQIAINTLVLIPLEFLLTWLVTWSASGCLAGLLYGLSLPFLCIFEWYYVKLLKQTVRDIRFLCTDTVPLQELRRQAFNPLKTLIYHE